jgi:zinc protease
MWLRVGTGSINEDENQRGLAHLLEHVAFNGSANFPTGTLIKRFEAAGLTFGAHQNATTGYIDTIYKLTVPNDPAIMDLGLLYFSDVAYRLTIDPEEVKRERHVVSAERRSRDNAAARAFNNQLFALVPGSRFAERLPIGDERVVMGATAEQLRAYYQKWYRPDNTVLFIAGDLDTEALDALVRKHFSSWPAATDPAPNHSPGIQFYKSDRAHVVHEYGLISGDVNVAYLEPPRDFGRTRGYRDWLVQSVGKQLLNWRLRDFILEGKVPFSSASATADTSFGATLVEMKAKGAPHDWEAVLKALLTEVKRARDHGFTDAEFGHALQVMRADYEKDALEEADAPQARWLTTMDSAVDENRRPLGARRQYELAQRLLPGITRAEVEQAIRARYAPERRTFTLALPRRADLKAPTSAELLKVAQSVEATPVAKLTERERPAKLLAKDPEPGRTTQNALNGELNVLSATLENGVRVHIRPMNYKKDHASVRITLAGGRLNETPLNLGITEAATLPFKVPATDTLSSTDIRRLMATKHVTLTGRDTPGALELDVEGQQRDLEEGLRLAHLLLTRARIEPAIFDKWQQQASSREANREGSVDAQLHDRVDALLTNNDPRFRVLSSKEVGRLKLADAQNWLNAMLAGAPIEVAIVGDLSHEQALALAAKYLGSLPKRPPAAGAYAAARNLAVTPGPHAALVKVDTATPKAMVYVGWRGPDWQDVHDWHVLDIAGRILTNRLLAEVRERRGMAYSIRARGTSNSLYRGNGRFRVSFIVDPVHAEEAADIVQRIVDEFVRNGPTAEELATAREQAALGFRSGSVGPEFWLDILSDLDYMGGDLKWVKNYLQNVEHYSREDLVAVLQKYFRPDRFIRVIGAPANLPSTSAEPTGNPVAAVN